MTRDETLKLQRHLNAQRLGPVLEDGVYGPATDAAYQRYLKLYTPVMQAPTPPAAKPWWTSRALWGALATILISIGGVFIDVSSLDAKELTDVLVSLSTGFAGLLALYGTIKRQAPIDPTLAAPGVRWGTGRARTDADKRVRDQPMPLRVDATEGAGGPDGPFFDS